jgi:hypothetical protein
MRRVSMATRDELIRALSRRYSEVRRIERSRILDEFVAVTGYHRKHAMRVLREERTGSRQVAARPTCLRRGGSGSDHPVMGSL